MERNGLAKRRDKIAAFLLFFLSFIEIVSLMAQIHFDWPNLLRVMSTFYILLCEIGYFFKLINFTVQRQNYYRILELMRHPQMNEFNEKHYEKINKMINMCQTIGKAFRFFCICFIVVYVVIPQITYDPNEYIPTAGYFFIDPKKYRFIVMLLELVLIGVTCAYDTNFDLLLLALISIASTHFEILEEKIMNIKDYKHEGCDDEESAFRNIKSYVIHQNFLMNFIDNIQNLFSYGILFKMIASVVIICLTGFHMLLIPTFSTQFFILINYVICILIQVGIYCWYGHYLFVAVSKNLLQLIYNKYIYQLLPTFDFKTN